MDDMKVSFRGFRGGFGRCFLTRNQCRLVNVYLENTGSIFFPWAVIFLAKRHCALNMH